MAGALSGVLGVGGVGVVPAAIMVRVRIGKAVIGVGWHVADACFTRLISFGAESIPSHWHSVVEPPNTRFTENTVQFCRRGNATEGHWQTPAGASQVQPAPIVRPVIS